MTNKANLAIRIGGWLSFCCTLFLGVILYVTATASAPFSTSDSVTMVTRQEGTNVLVESRGFVGDGDTEMTIYRSLHRQYNGGHGVSVEGGGVVNQVGEFVVLRSIILPPHMTGAWCSKAVVYWRPTLSLAQHSTQLPDLCFEVPQHD